VPHVPVEQPPAATPDLPPAQFRSDPVAPDTPPANQLAAVATAPGVTARVEAGPPVPPVVAHGVTATSAAPPATAGAGGQPGVAPLPPVGPVAVAPHGAAPAGSGRPDVRNRAATAGANASTDTWRTARATPGAPGGDGPADPAAATASLLRTFERYPGRFPSPVETPAGVLVVPADAPYALRFQPAELAAELRAFRSETGQLTADGKPIIQVTMAHNLPADGRPRHS